MDWFGLFLNGLGLAGQGVIHVLFVSRLVGKRWRWRHLGGYLLLLWALDRGSTALDVPWVLVIAAEAVLLWALGRFGLGGGGRAAALAAVMGVYITQLSFGLMNSVEAAVFPRLVGRAVLLPLVVLATLVAFGLCAGCCVLVTRLLGPLEEGAPEAGLLLLPGLFFCAVELYIMDTAYSGLFAVLGPEAAGLHMALLILQVLGLGALLCTLYAYRCVRRGFEAQAGLLSLLQATRAQRAYVAEAQERYRQTRAFRHDIKNHLTVLRRLLDSGQTAEGRAYLERIEAVSDRLSLPCRTGNGVVDVLLGEKLGLAERRGIGTEVSLTLPGEWGVEDFDLCVVFANALDNALAACEDGAGEIRLTGERQGDFYLLSFENTCPPGPPAPMGTGLSNIQAVAEKYRGAMRTERSGGRFRLDVLLNIS